MSKLISLPLTLILDIFVANRAVHGSVRVGFVLWVFWVTGSSPDQAQNHHIKPRFERKSTDLSKNQRKTTTSSLDLSENHRIWAKIEAKTPTSSSDLSKNFFSSPDLRKIEAQARANPSKIFISPPDLSKKT